ncbi:MAG: phosphodiester glycosidase family protein [Clostridia bacterium]|nr:phosphodiester glycosidase family protein [Clostridia bacterium]
MCTICRWIFPPGPLKYVFVEAQGRNDESIGVTTDQMAVFMKELGVKEAYCLDGENSCVMTFNSKYYDSNYAGSKREQSDIICMVSAVPEDTWQ